MGAFLGSFRMARVALRNHFLLKPKGRRAARRVAAYLEREKIPHRSVEVWQGLAGPEGLSCLVFVATDTDKARLGAEGHVSTLTALFRSALTELGYPALAVPRVGVTSHSDEEIRRVGSNVYFR